MTFCYLKISLESLDTSLIYLRSHLRHIFKGLIALYEKNLQGHLIILICYVNGNYRKTFNFKYIKLGKTKNLFIAVAGKNVLRRNLYKRSASLRNDFRPIYEYE